MRGTDMSANQCNPIELNSEDLSMVWGGQSLVHVELSLPSGAVVGVATGNGASVTANAGTNGYALTFITGSSNTTSGGVGCHHH
jgi:hypothetical protein